MSGALEQLQNLLYMPHCTCLTVHALLCSGGIAGTSINVFCGGLFPPHGPGEMLRNRKSSTLDLAAPMAWIRVRVIVSVRVRVRRGPGYGVKATSNESSESYV